MRLIQLMIVGAQKAATSSWLRYLAQHPDIETHQQREMGFFTNEEEFAAGFENAWARYFGHARPESMLMAKAAGLMYVPEAVSRLRAHNPQMLLIVSLRNPVNRAYSAYWYARRHGIETLASFEEALAAEPERLADGFHKHRLVIYVRKGEYIRYIRDLYRHFPPERVIIALVEDLHNDPGCTVQHIYQALPGLDNSFFPDVRRRHNESTQPRSQLLARLLWSPTSSAGAKRVVRRLLPARSRDRLQSQLARLNEREFQPPPMSSQTRVALIEHFRPFNQELAELLQRDLSHWQVAEQ